MHKAHSTCNLIQMVVTYYHAMHSTPLGTMHNAHDDGKTLFSWFHFRERNFHFGFRSFIFILMCIRYLCAKWNGAVQKKIKTNIESIAIDRGMDGWKKGAKKNDRARTIDSIIINACVLMSSIA